MAFNYGNRQYQQIPDQYNLKPVNYAETTSLAGSSYSNASNPYYSGGAELERLSTKDTQLKDRIRMLRVFSRIIAVLTSGATMAPLAITIIKFLQTRNQILIVDGEPRTAWASGTVTWYTYTYFGVAVVSFLLNAAILLSYCCGGVKRANKTSTISGVWSGILIAFHIVIWIVSIAIYRYGKIPKNGKNNDLWGWTCSTAAEDIQEQVTNINFSEYCTIQSSSFYTGIVQVITSLLSAGIYLMAFLRMRSKKRLLKAEVRVSQSAEPLRS